MSTKIVLSIALLLFCSILANAHEPRTIHDYATEGTATIGMPIQPLREVDVEEWSRILGASKAQLQFMKLEYRRFVDRHNVFMDRDAPRQLALAADFQELWIEPGPNSPEFLDLMRRMDQAQSRMRRELSRIERSYVDTIEAVLTQEQRALINILRNDAQRRYCRTFVTTMRWCNLDLRNVWNDSAKPLASPHEQEQIETMLAEYDSHLTSLICRKSNLHMELRQQLAKNRIAREQGTVTNAQANDRYRRVMNRRFEAADAIRSLNRHMTDRISELLSDQTRTSFQDAVRQAVFPELYPDRAALYPLFEELASDDRLDEDMRNTVTILHHQYRTECDRVCNTLEAKCIKWGDNTERGVTGYETQLLPDALEPFLEERSELSRRYLKKLTELLDPEALDRHTASIPGSLREEEKGEAAEPVSP